MKSSLQNSLLVLVTYYVIKEFDLCTACMINIHVLLLIGTLMIVKLLSL